MQLEPVNPAAHFDANGAGLAIELAFRLNPPAVTHQGVDRAGQVLGQDDPFHLGRVGVSVVNTKASFRQPSVGGLLSGQITQKKTASLFMQQPAAHLLLLDDDPVIVKKQLGAQPVWVRFVALGLANLQIGSGRAGNLFDLKLRWPLHPRQAGRPHQPLDEFPLVFHRDLQAP